MRKLCRGMVPVCAMAVALVITGVAAASAASPGISHGPGVKIFHSPRIKLSRPHAAATNAGWSSTNWSGYAITGSTYTSVTAKWTVPTAAPSSTDTFSSNWVGIDGFNNSDLIQTGTESDFSGGSAHYDAWWEILPAAETVIPSITVSPGDTITASVTQESGSTWQITITDGSQSFTTTQTYTGPGTSAEWIEEAPTIGGSVAPLANYGQATFDPGTANGANPGLTASDGGVMVRNNEDVSTPSNPDSDTDGFNVAFGATAPAPPSS